MVSALNPCVQCLWIQQRFCVDVCNSVGNSICGDLFPLLYEIVGFSKFSVKHPHMENIEVVVNIFYRALRSVIPAHFHKRSRLWGSSLTLRALRADECKTVYSAAAPAHRLICGINTHLDGRGPRLHTQSDLWSKRWPSAKLKTQRNETFHPHTLTHWSVDSHVWWRAWPGCRDHTHISPALPGNNCVTRSREGGIIIHTHSHHETGEICVNSKWLYKFRRTNKGGQKRCLWLWLTLYATRRSDGCFQTQSVPSLSGPQGLPV